MEYGSQQLSFSRDQIKSVLLEFIDLFSNANFIHNLQHVAPDEKKINTAVENTQKQIFNAYGVDPEKGYQDLAKIREVFKDDSEIIQLLVASATKEEQCFQEAMKNPHSSHGHGHGHGHGPQQPLPKLTMSFQEVYDMVVNIPSEASPNQEQLAIIQAAMVQFPQDQKVQLTQLMMLRAGPEQRQMMKQQVEMLKQKMASMPPQQAQMVQMQITSMEQMLQKVESMASQSGQKPTTTTTTTTPGNTPTNQQPTSSPSSGQQNFLSMQKPTSHAMKKE